MELELIGESVWDTYFRIGKLIEAGVYSLPGKKDGTLTVKPRSKSGTTQTFVGYPRKGGKPGRTAHASGRAGPGAKSTDKPVQRVLAHSDATGKSSVKDTTPK
jgi:hypothetical protein